MSAARTTFFDAIASIKEAAAAPLLIDTFPPSAHNNRARILRCGLVVSTFSHLESYIEERYREVLLELASSTIPYTSFADQLKRLFTHHVVVGLSQRINYLSAADSLRMVESHLPLMVGYSSNPPSFLHLGFSPKGSNVSANDISDLIKAFGVGDVWNKLNTLAQAIGGGRLKIYDDFQNLLQTRNAGAHDSAANVPSSDVTSHADTAALVGIVVDMALSHVVSCYARSAKAKTAAAAANKLSIAFRFLDRDGSRWRERSISLKTLCIHSNLAAAEAKTPRPVFVVRNASLFPIRLV